MTKSSSVTELNRGCSLKKGLIQAVEAQPEWPSSSQLVDPAQKETSTGFVWTNQDKVAHKK